MDWSQTKNVADANLDTIVGKVSNPKIALTTLRKRITAEVDKVEGHLLALDERVTALPGLLDQADRLLAKVDAVIAKAHSEGRADLAQAAAARKQKHEAERAALESELEGIDAAQTQADELLEKLRDKLAEVDARIDMTPDIATPAPAPTSAPTTPAPTPAPAKPKTKPGSDALDDEFAALLGDLDIDLAKVELPKKKKASALPVPDDSDDGIPELVTVRDDELPEGEELPPLEMPKKGARQAPPAKAQPPKAQPDKVGPIAPTKVAKVSDAKADKAAPAKPPAAAGTEGEKKSKAWLWITGAVIVVGGGGAAVAHFVLHLF